MNHGIVYWITGTNEDKTSSLACNLHQTVDQSIVIDYDYVKYGLCIDVKGDEGHKEIIRRISWIGRMLYEKGMAVIVCTSTLPACCRRDMRLVIPEKSFVEIHLEDPTEENHVADMETPMSLDMKFNMSEVSMDKMLVEILRKTNKKFGDTYKIIMAG